MDSVETPTTGPLHEEQKHLEDVLDVLHEQIRKFRKYSREPELRGDDDDDRLEAVTADEVADEAVFRMREERLHHLMRSLDEPYFGRFDFQEDGGKHAEPLYIGKRGLDDLKSGERLVIDWRAPVASVFYSFTGQGDQATYESPTGPISGQVYLKRNILVREGSIQRVVDSYVSGQDNLNVTDEFLLYRLGENKDSRLRDIVSTIQAEQDQIIRAPRDRAVVIQGVAGSGKTTVALHRLAYLLYQHSDSLRADKMVIFAPNSMFVDYISEVLPELGVGNIQQTTFAAWALRVLDFEVVLDPDRDRSREWFEHGDSTDRETRFEITKAKGSLQFRERLRQKVEQYKASLVPDVDFEPFEGAVLEAAAVRRWFEEEYANYPLQSRRDRVLARVKRWYEMEYKEIKATDKTKSIRKTASARYKAYETSWPVISVYGLYTEVLDELGWPRPEAEQGSKRKRPRPIVDVEDLPGLIALYLELYSIDARDRFDHVVIDEAQDSSPLQLDVLKEFCRSQSFTILGDLSQSIHTYQGITDWTDFLELFPEDKRMYFQLNVSYRSTMEIIEFANAIIRPFGNFTLAHPVFRSGEPVDYVQVNEQDRGSVLAMRIASLRQAGASTVAVLCRTEAETQKIHKELSRQGVASTKIDSHQSEYHGGVSVLPVYLAKGLEFDGVIMVETHQGNYDDGALSAKLLYVGCTRALHSLCFISTGTPATLLEQTREPAS